MKRIQMAWVWGVGCLALLGCASSSGRQPASTLRKDGIVGNSSLEGERAKCSQAVIAHWSAVLDACDPNMIKFRYRIHKNTNDSLLMPELGSRSFANVGEALEAVRQSKGYRMTRTFFRELEREEGMVKCDEDLRSSVQWPIERLAKQGSFVSRDLKVMHEEMGDYHAIDICDYADRL